MSTLTYAITLDWKESYKDRLHPIGPNQKVVQNISVVYEHALKKWQLMIVARVFSLKAKTRNGAVEEASLLLLDMRPELFEQGLLEE